jgi:hypothetical protein
MNRHLNLPVALLTLVFAASVAAQETPRFKVSLRRADDSSAIVVEKERTVFTLKSPFGISQAVIERLDEKWPRAMVVRLHLKGLESFRADNGKTTVNAAVSMRDGKIALRQWLGDKETPGLDEKSPYWMAVRMIGNDGKPATQLPLKDGYFEVLLPEAFFTDNPRSITLQWIDFHRP